MTMTANEAALLIAKVRGETGIVVRQADRRDAPVGVEAADGDAVDPIDPTAVGLTAGVRLDDAVGEPLGGATSASRG